MELVQLDGYYGLQTTQRMIGFNSEDLLDEITVIWKYENGKWTIKEAKGNHIGNILYWAIERGCREIAYVFLSLLISFLFYLKSRWDVSKKFEINGFFGKFFIDKLSKI